MLDGSFDDTYEVSIKVTDLTGEEITKVYEFDFDSQMPTMSSPTVYNTDGWDSALTPNLRISNPIDHFSIEVSDNLSGVNLTSPNTYLRLHKADTSIVPGTFEIVGNTLYWRLTNRLPNDGTADGSYYLSYSAVDKAGNLLRDRINFQVLNPLSPVVESTSPVAESVIVSLTPNVISLDFTDERGIDLENYHKTYIKLTTPQNSVISHNNGATLTIIKNTDTKYRVELALDEELAVEGIYRVDYRIENNQGYSDSGVWSFTLDNAAPIITNIVANLSNGTEQPLSDGTIIYRPITSIRATVSDKTSKLDLDPSKTFIKVTNQSGSEIIGVLNYNESTNTLLLTFDSELEELDMRYDVVVKATDVLGNSEEEILSFNLKSMKTEIVEVYPTSGSKTNATINYTYVKFEVEDEVEIDDIKTNLRLKTPAGSFIDRNNGAKQSIIKNGNMFEVRLTLDKALSLVGDDDGLYEMSLNIATELFEEGPYVSTFTYDRTAPYYTNLPANPINSTIYSVQADYLDLTSGVNFAPNITKLTLLDANSNVIPGRREVVGNTIKWTLDIPVETNSDNAGTYYLNIQITDNAGNVKTDKLAYELIPDTTPQLITYTANYDSGYTNQFAQPLFEATFFSVHPLIEEPTNSYIEVYHPNGTVISDNNGGRLTYSKQQNNYKLSFNLSTPLSESGEDDGDYKIVYKAENILNQSITDEIFFKYDTIKPYVDNYRLNTTEELLMIDNQYFFNKPIDLISVDVNDLLSGVDFATNLTRIVLYDSNNEVVQGTGSVNVNTVSWTLKNTLNPSDTHQTYRIYVRATDKAGNQLVVNRNFVLLKTIQPSITSTYPAEDSFNNTLNNNSVTVRVTDNNHFGIDSSKTTIELKGAGINYSPTNNATLSVQNISANTYDISLTLDSSLGLDGSFDDTYEVSIKVTDLTGEEITKIYEFAFDSQMPTMSSPVVYNTDGWDSALTPNLRISNPIDHFSIEVSDNLSGVNLTSPNTYLRLHKGDTSIVPGTFEIVGNTLYWRLTNRLPNDGTADGSYYLSYSVVDKAGNLLRDRIIFQVLNPLSPIVDNMSPTAGSTITSLTPNIISLDFTDERGIDLEDYSKTYLRLTTPQNSVISHNNGATLTIIKNTDTAYKIELALDEELAVEGIYRVDYRIENNQGYSDSGVWSFTLDNAAPIITNIVANLANGTEQPLSDGTIIYRPITSIRATVSDKTSKLDLDPSKTFIKVTNQSGSEVIGVLNYNESTNTLLLTFDSVLEELDMRYDVVVKAIDVLGNSEEETFSFNLKSMKTEIVEVYPASNSNINTNISYVYVKMSFEDVVNLDNNKTKLRLKTPSGDYIEHNIGAKQSVSKSGNTYEVRLTLNQPLSTNGDDDGKYQTDLVVSTDLFEEGPFTSEFTYDKVAPYYTNIAINPINSVLTSIFDHSVQSIQADYFDLTSGVNFAPNLTKLTLLDANSNVIPGRREVDGNTIKWILNDPIEELVANNGTYYINLQITDLAGNVRNEKVSYEMAVDTRPELVSFSPIENSGYVNNLTPPIFEATFTSIYPLVTNPNYSYINIVHPNGSIISDNNGGKIRYTSQQNTYVMAFELAAPLSDTGEDDGAYTIEVRAQNVKEETFETSFIIVYDTQLPYYDNLQVMHTDGPTDISGDSYPIYKDITAVKVRYVDLLAGMYVSPSITNISLYDPADNILGGILSFEKEGDNVYATWTLNEGSVIKADGTQDGKYKVKLRATDKAGNQFIQTVSIEVITVTSPSDILTSLDPMYNAHLSWSFNSTSSGQNSYFEIFRKVDVQDWKLIATTKDSYYTDSLFNEKDGRYQYKVRTVFVNPSSGENTYSEAVISDQVDLKRFYQVTFNLLMQDESSPKDALLHIISNDGLYNQEHSKVSNSSGKIVIDDVFAETYLLTISKLGYDTIVDTLTIDASNTEFTYTLGESSTLFSYTSEKNDLFQNFPNPFNPTTEIRFALKETSKVSLKVYNTKGQQVITLVDNETLGEGYHRVRWDGTNKNNSTVPSGIYFYQINISSSTGVYQKKMKMLLLK
ncbi:MAG: Ig-like domain repeat protein [Sphaerochaetaceae bacterium]